MEFTLRIDLGNDAMRTNGDVADALRDLAVKFDRYGTDECVPEGSNVRDANGNPVGRWEITA
jgi:hypothetical protein